MPLEPAPDDIDEVLAHARELAEAMETSDRGIALRAARRALESDAEAQAAYLEFEAAGREVARIAATRAPTLEERSELEHARQRARANELVWELLRREADYIELTLQVEAIVLRSAPLRRRRGGGDSRVARPGDRG